MKNKIGGNEKNNTGINNTGKNNAGVNNRATSGITIKDTVGYAFGDFGMQAVFGLIASVLQKYYTDILQIPIASVMLLFILARVWDAVNDPMWGAFVDSRPKKEGGRYRRFMKYFCLPMGMAAVLMFVKIPGLSGVAPFVYACITYTMFGMIYTCVNVPYGSLAAVITDDDGERTTLSTARSIGSALGTVPAMVLIVVCYTKTDAGKVMDYTKVIIGVCIVAVIAVVFSFLSQKMVTERIINPPKAAKSKRELAETIWKILKTRPFITLSIAAMLYLAASVFSQSYYTYLADKYFGMNSLSMLAMVCQYLPVAVIMVIIGKLNRRVGRKELCAYGMFAAGVFYLILFFMHTANPWIFLLFCLLAGIGNAFLFLQVWALAAEVVHYNRRVNNITDDAVSYSLFSFIRKLGHAVAAVFVNMSLLRIGYSTANLSESTLNGMYNSSVLIPAILYFVVFLILQFGYPLKKK